MERILDMQGTVSGIEKRLAQDAADRRWRQRVQDVTVGFILIWLILLTVGMLLP
jgi:hypothetical protein